MSVHAEAVIVQSDPLMCTLLIVYQQNKLSSRERILLDAVHEVKPQKEDDWAKVAAKATYISWRNVSLIVFH